MHIYKYTLLILTLLLNSAYSSIAQDAYNIDKVVIDAGHGGKDSGAVGKHSKEKTIALSVALKVGKLINDNIKGVDIIYTRDKDVFVELHKRADIANKSKADVLISIHCNASSSTKAKGTETWIIGTSRSEKNLAVAKKENAAILLEADYSKNYNNFDPNSTESYIMFEMLQNSYRGQSMLLAQSVQNQFRDRMHRVDRGVKEAGFLVLVYSTMPSILVELGFISNAEEEKFLLSDQAQDYLASAIYRAFRDYKNSMEKGKEISNTIIEENTNNVADTTKVDNKKNESAYFGVQFTTSTSIKKASDFKNIENVWHYSQNGSYKYVSGKFSSFSKAKKALKNITKSYSDAFIVSFINDKRVSRKECETKINELNK